MKKYLAALAFFIALIPVSVGAVTILTQEAEDSIRENCTDAQQNMQRLQRADAVTRINRGNNYATLQRLMSAMSARAAANAYSVSELAEINQQFNSLKESFISQYTDYEIALRTVVNMNCSSDTVLFYDRLEAVRTERSELAEIIEQMEQLTIDYEAAVLKLRDVVEERNDE